ncbi:MAG: hypothetical protein WC329_04360 [Candidatus Omnitrophota bacterium]
MIDGQKSYCGSAEPSVVTEDFILKRWGGGKYQLQALNNGRYVTGGFRAVSIFEPPDDPLKRQYAPERESGSNNGELSALRESLNRQQEMILRLIEANATAKPQAAGVTMADVTAMMRDIAAMTPKAADPMAALTPVLELVKSTMELSREAVAGEDPKAFWPKLIGDAINKVPAILGAMRPNAPAADAGEHANGGDMGAIQRFLSWGISELKKKAALGKIGEAWVKDPLLYADLILDNIEDPKWRPFANLVNRPFEELAAFDPQLKEPPYFEWFKELFDAVKRGLNGNAEIEPSPGTPGREANADGNEAAHD